jgi:hypothetical protein
MPNYGDPHYWDKRYQNQEGKTFDWLEDYESLCPLFQKFTDRSHKIMMLGCGNSGWLTRTQ